MLTAFNLLRMNDCIWPYVIHRYLHGNAPHKQQGLYWALDLTNIPAALSEFYMRNLFQRNDLVKPGGISIKGIKIDLQEITLPTYFLGLADDHIAPWKSSYQSSFLTSGSVRFVLGEGNHMGGLLNLPPRNKYAYLTNDDRGSNPEEWRDRAIRHKGPWLQDWLEWMIQFRGEALAAKHPHEDPSQRLEDAPGTFAKKVIVNMGGG